MSRLVGFGAGLFATALLAAAPLAAQNLLVNPNFDGGLDGWTPDAGAGAAYSSRDATNSQFSGSALVTNSVAGANVPLGLSQCVSLSPGAAYSISARFLIPSGQAASATARVFAQFYAGASCGGGPLGNFGNGTPKITTFDTWGTISSGFSAATAAVSARVSVWIQKVEAGGSVQGNLDLVAFGPKAVLTIPASASIHGQNQTFFHTDVWLFNGSAVRPLFVLLKHLCFPGQACTGSGPSVMLPPRASQLLDDVLAGTFHDIETAGAIELTYASAEGRLTAVSRTYSPSLPSPTTGSGIPALRSDQARTRAVLTGIAGSGGTLAAGFRSNVGAYNPGDVAATVMFAVYTGDGTQIGSFVTRTLGPHEPAQVNDVFTAAGVGDVESNDAYVIVTSSVPVFSYATVIDNRSADSIFLSGEDDAP
jgi:hypothetical protein